MVPRKDGVQVPRYVAVNRPLIRRSSSLLPSPLRRLHEDQLVMEDALSTKISKLLRKDWVHLDALPAVAISAIGKQSVTDISWLGSGSYNYVYKVTFSDSSSIAASISSSKAEHFVAAAKESELETMRFVRESGLYPTIPVPCVHSWDLTFTNPLGAPYVLMDVVEGVTLDQRSATVRGWKLRGLDALESEEQLLVVETLARMQAALMKPLPSHLDKIGSLRLPADGCDVVVGPMATLSGRVIKGPWRSLADMWHDHLRKEVCVAMKEFTLLEKDLIPHSPSLTAWTSTPQEFGSLLQMLAALVPHFIPPAPYLPLVLQHPDMALRNVIVDPDDHTKVRGVIDWAGARIVPFILAGQYPDDLRSSGGSPFSRDPHLYPNENWSHVPNDWTSLGDREKWPQIIGEPGETVDVAVGMKANLNRFYLCQYFGMCISKEMQQLHGDTDLSHATLFADAPYYLKFNEVMTGSWSMWIEHKKWIKETFQRLKALGSSTPKLVRGPNVYHKTYIDPSSCDLGEFDDDLRMANTHDIDAEDNGGV